MPADARPKTAPYEPGPKSLALFDEDQRHMTPGLQSVALFSKLALDRGEGCELIDADGRRYLDFMAGVCVASLGHAHPRYAKALADQAARLTVGSFTTANRAAFGRTLASVAPGALSKVQLYSSGAEAVEAAIRLAKSRTGHYEVMSFWGGFHGKTGGVLGLLAADTFKHGLGPLAPGSYSSPFPNPYRCPLGTEGEHDCAGHCLDFLREKIKRETAGSLAAVICEPIQGTAGNIVPPKGWLAGLKSVAEENGALLIADEMITGFGRSGRMFGVEHEGVVPDVMTIGKGVASGFPVSGLVTTPEIAESRPFANPSGSSSSYGGNPLAAAACRATLDAILEEKLVENSREVGAFLLGELRRIAERFPFIGEVRGEGLMIGIEFVKDRRTKEPLPKEACKLIFFEALKRGLMTMAYSPVFRINPPLILTREQAAEGAAVLEESFEAAAPRLGV